MTKDICVITGGGSGMGLAVAQLLGADYDLIISGRTVAKLDDALAVLRSAGITAEGFACDVSDRASVQALARHTAAAGRVRVVIHAAGISPQMSTGADIFTINAMGTIYVNEEFAALMGAGDDGNGDGSGGASSGSSASASGGVIIDVASNAAYLAAEAAREVADLYPLAQDDPEDFKARILAHLAATPETVNRESLGYMISKHFVIWYAARSACEYGADNIRVLSVSPGTFLTPMGVLEGEAAENMALCGALGRVGEVEEIAAVLAFVASPQASYLTGTDILCDGGIIAALG